MCVHLCMWLSAALLKWSILAVIDLFFTPESRSGWKMEQLVYTLCACVCVCICGLVCGFLFLQERWRLFWRKWSLMPLSIPYTLYLYLCVPECVFSCTVHLSIFACVCTVLPFLCRRLGRITTSPFWLLPLSLYPSLVPLPTWSPYAVQSSCYTYCTSRYMCPAAYWHWAGCLWKDWGIVGKVWIADLDSWRAVSNPEQQLCPNNLFVWNVGTFPRLEGWPKFIWT